MPDAAEFSATELSCTIGNNLPHGEHHRAGYNGIFAMSSPHCEDSPYVPAYAGWNLEHYFDGRGRSDDDDTFFEPRRQPMTFSRVSSTEAELYQADTPVYGVESRTRFHLRPPYYIDVEYQCVPHKSDLPGGFLGVFWASYINAPIDKSIYFLTGGDTPRWSQFCTQAHNRDSTVRHDDDTFEPEFERGGDALFGNNSPLRYTRAFYYGRFRNMVLIHCFRTEHILRFAHSPSGGGTTPEGDDTNPAWDFQLLIPGYSAGRTYTLESRVIFKPWAGREDVVSEAESWLQN